MINLLDCVVMAYIEKLAEGTIKGSKTLIEGVAKKVWKWWTKEQPPRPLEGEIIEVTEAHLIKEADEVFVKESSDRPEIHHLKAQLEAFIKELLEIIRQWKIENQKVPAANPPSKWEDLLPLLPLRRYWVMAPYKNKNAEAWEGVWVYDREENSISIGWKRLEDISRLDEDGLKKLIANKYPRRKPRALADYFRMLWNFHHAVRPRDFIIARRGRREMVAVGIVKRGAYYDERKAERGFENARKHGGKEIPYVNHLDVEWHDCQHDFSYLAFPSYTLHELEEAKFRKLVPERCLDKLLSSTGSS